MVEMPFLNRRAFFILCTKDNDVEVVKSVVIGEDGASLTRLMVFVSDPWPVSSPRWVTICTYSCFTEIASLSRKEEGPP